MTDSMVVQTHSSGFAALLFVSDSSRVAAGNEQ